MNLQVFEFDGSLSDPAYLAALERDITAYEVATETDPQSRSFHAWADAKVQDIAAERQRAERQGGFDKCQECGVVIEPSVNGLCSGCWQGQRGDDL